MKAFFVVLCFLSSLVRADIGLMKPNQDADKALKEVLAEKTNTREGSTWEAGPNWTLNYKIETITGLNVPKDWKKNAVFETVKLREALPKSWDWRETLGSNLPPIKNQRSCGSCWAFGTVAAFEFAYSMKNKSVRQFSEQELVSCSSYGSCGGGFFAHGYHVKPGAALSSDFPYVASNARCKPNLKHEDKLVGFKFLGSKNKNPTTEELKAAIKQYGAIPVTVTANNAMSAYKGGIFTGCTAMPTNHIVALVGWGYDEKTKKEYAIMRNSWGESWGEKGYMRMPWGCSRLGEDATLVEY